MYVVCLDLEGVLIPEIWINVALKTGIEELKLTTRDISDYDVLIIQTVCKTNDEKTCVADTFLQRSYCEQ
jgi:phosphoserine/homoserine phosphotransferase